VKNCTRGLPVDRPLSPGFGTRRRPAAWAAVIAEPTTLTGFIQLADR